MADGQITWRGLTFGGDSPFGLTSIAGWEDLSDVADYSEPRARGNGEHVGDLYGRARIVTVEGEIVDQVALGQLVAELRAATSLDSTVRDLSVDLFGVVLTAGARLLRRSVTVDNSSYSFGAAKFALQWRCPDPLRYDAAETTISTGLPSGGGGLAYPLTYPLDYGAAGTTGNVTLVNGGTADAPIRFAVRGGLPQGFEISAAGSRLRYPVPVPAGQVIEIDTAAGTVLVEGTASRRQNLTVADWIMVPAGMSLPVQFTSLGGAFDANASLTAIYAAAFW